jgi:hypothetical protein
MCSLIAVIWLIGNLDNQRATVLEENVPWIHCYHKSNVTWTGVGPRLLLWETSWPLELLHGSHYINHKNRIYIEVHKLHFRKILCCAGCNYQYQVCIPNSLQNNRKCIVTNIATNGDHSLTCRSQQTFRKNISIPPSMSEIKARYQQTARLACDFPWPRVFGQRRIQKCNSLYTSNKSLF